MIETYVTYKLWDGCRAPNNLESGTRLVGQRVGSVSVDRGALLELAEEMDRAYPDSRDVAVEYIDDYARRIREACGCDPEARLWKVTGGPGLPMLLVRAAGADAALARAREVDPRYCGMQRWDYRFDGVPEPGAGILE